MKYKEIFKFWGFYLLVISYTLFSIVRYIKDYGSISFTEILGTIIGSFLISLLFVSILWAISRILPKKDKK